MVNPKVDMRTNQPECCCFALCSVLPADPDYFKLPWARLGLAGWGVVMFVAPFLGAIAVGAFVAWLGARKASKGITAAAPAEDAEKATTNVVVVKDNPTF
jgi:hypothetical protein